MEKLETQTKHVCCVVPYTNKNGRVNKLDNEELDRRGFDYYVICHDKDVDVNGELKTKHYHIVINSLARHRISWYLDKVAIAFNCNSTDGIEIQVCDSIIGSVQYLIHKNNDNKYKYDSDLIVTNVKRDSLLDMLEVDLRVEDNLTIPYLIEKYECAEGNLLKFMSYIGVEKYQKYHNVIYEFVQEYGKVYRQKVMINASKDALAEGN